MSMTLCQKCGCLADTDAYPEGYYRIDANGKETLTDDYYCETCNQEEQ